MLYFFYKIKYTIPEKIIFNRREIMNKKLVLFIGMFSLFFIFGFKVQKNFLNQTNICLLYTSDAADELYCV